MCHVRAIADGLTKLVGSLAMFIDWNALPYKEFLASAFGAGVAMIPVYFLWFGKMLETKDAHIERLNDQIKSLEKEQVSEIIKEKDVLIADLKTRAQEKVEMEKTMVSMTKQVEAENARVLAVSAQVREATALVPDRMRNDQVLGLAVGIAMIARIAKASSTVTLGDDRALKREIREVFRDSVERLNALRAGNLLAVSEAVIKGFD